MISAIRSGPLLLGYHVTKPTNDGDVLGLMRKLRPLDCGFNLIRIGAERDGGYLVPDDLEGIEYCFSPGVNVCSDFEDQLADRNIHSFLADYSVDSPPISRNEFTFDKKFLGSSDRDPYFTLASWKEKYLNGYTGDMILQMDIEGSEYEVILNIPDGLLNQFRILVIEFHQLDQIFDPFSFRMFSTCFEKLLQFFEVVHIHPNNNCISVKKGDIEIPRLLEFTFLNKRRVSAVVPHQLFPHPLDTDNANGPHLSLPQCWYSSPESTWAS